MALRDLRVLCAAAFIAAIPTVLTAQPAPPALVDVQGGQIRVVTVASGLVHPWSLAFGQPSQAERREPLLRCLSLRIRDVRQSRDGFIYVATERSFGGTEANGSVLRLEPVAAQ